MVNAPSSFRGILARLFNHLSPKHRRQFWWLCLLNIGMMLVEMGVAGAVSLLGVAMASPQSLSKVPYLDRVLHLLPQPETIHPDLMPLLFVLFCVAAATCLKNLMTACVTYAQAYYSQSLARHVGKLLFRRFLYAPHIWHVSQNSAHLLTIMGWASSIGAYSLGLQTLLTQLCIAVTLLVAALIVNPAASLFLFSCTGIIACLVYRYAKNKAYACGNDLARFGLFTGRVAMQGIHGQREIAIADKQPEFETAYARHIPDIVSVSARQSLYPPLPQWILESSGMFLLFGALIYVALMGAGPAKAAGTLTLLAAVSWRLLPAANKGVGALLTMRGQLSMVEQVFDRMENTPAAVEIARRAIVPFERSISFIAISFRYPNSMADPALQDISLRIRHGSMVGVVGLSGSGKSTLAGILTGGLRPDSGEIIVDDAPFEAAKMRLRLGFVPQSLYLLDASVLENVAFTVAGEEIDEDRVRRCCGMAAMDFIDDLPQGLNTVLGERGVRLSGGQIQRVGIARALYGRPDLLVFDEATSALDGATEKTIQKTIEGLRKSVTMLIIAHRLSTVRDCDYLYWLDRGRIRLEGTPGHVLPEYSKFLDHVSAQKTVSGG